MRAPAALLVALSLTAITASASAAPKGSRVAIIVTFVKAPGRDADLSALLPAVAASLSPLAPSWGPPLAEEIDRAFGERPLALSDQVLAQLPKAADRLDRRLGLDEGNRARNLRDLEELRHSLVASQASLAFDARVQGARLVYFSVLETLARSYLEDGKQAKAIETLAELARSFPGRPLTRSSSDALKRVYATLAESHRGKAVEVNSAPRLPESRVYANGNEMPSWRTPTTVGDYLVFVKTTKGDSRVHTIHVSDGPSPPRATIDLAFDLALLTDRTIGFRFDDLQDEAQLREQFCRRLRDDLGVDTLIVLSFGSFDGKTGLRLAAYTGAPRPTFEFAEASSAREVAEDRVHRMTNALLSKLDGRSTPGALLAGAPSQSSTRPVPPAPVVAKQSTPVTPPPAPMPRTEAANRRKSTPIEDAEQAYIVQHLDQAEALASSLAKKPSSPDEAKRAHRILALVACEKGDAKRVAELVRRIDSNARSLIRYVCGKHRITVPSDASLGISED